MGGTVLACKPASSWARSARQNLVGALVVTLAAGLLAAEPVGAQSGSPPVPPIIQAIHSHKVMDVFEASDFPGARVVQMGLHRLPNQLWRVRQFATVNGLPLVLIQSEGSGLVLDVMDDSRQPGARLVQDNWAASHSQLWLLYPFGTTGFDVLVNVNSGVVADVAGGSTADAAAIMQWPWHGGLNQVWSVPNPEPLTG